ncbi:MAG: hypothetical protein AAFX09_06185 [Pseudomonadota bacterium]
MDTAAKTAGYGRNAGRRWRGSDIAELKRLARQGAALRLISLKLGRPDAAIRAKAASLGLELRVEPRVRAPKPKRTLARPAPPTPMANLSPFIIVPRQLELF